MTTFISQREGKHSVFKYYRLTQYEHYVIINSCQHYELKQRKTFGNECDLKILFCTDMKSWQSEYLTNQFLMSISAPVLLHFEYWLVYLCIYLFAHYKIHTYLLKYFLNYMCTQSFTYMLQKHTFTCIYSAIRSFKVNKHLCRRGRNGRMPISLPSTQYKILHWIK